MSSPTPTSFRRPSIPVMAACGAVIAIGVSFFLLTQPSVGAPKGLHTNDAPIRAMLTKAIVAAQTAALPPKSERGKKLSQATIGQIRNAARQQLAQYFVRDELARRLGTVDSLLGEESSGDEAFLDAGVDNIVIGDVTIDGDSASADGSGDAWLDVAQIEDDGSLRVAHPRNTMIFSFDLIWDGTTWMVSGQSGQFAPDSEP
jgi:hypothetical protein